MRIAARTIRTLVAFASTPISPPSQPGCSRWLTCSCCQKQNYFSPNQKGRPASRLQISRAAPPEVEEAPSSSTQPKAHFLPLPPRLPYSPTSVPFKRHLDILSLSAISSTPAESWDIYLSLHPSLRRYIPDDIFRSLLSHQLSSPLPKQRWIRSRTLIEFGQRCGMSIDGLGVDIVQRALEAGLVYVVELERRSVQGVVGLLRTLWDSLMRLKKGKAAELDAGLRRLWLQSHLVRFEAWLARAAKNEAGIRSGLPKLLPPEVVNDMLDRRGGAETGDIINELLRACRKMGRNAIQDAIRTGVRCWECDIDIPDATVERLLLRLHYKYHCDLRPVLDDAIRGAPDAVIARTEQVLSTVSAQTASASQRALVLVGQVARPSVEDMVTIGLEILRGECPAKGFSAVIDLCQRILNARHADAEELYLSLSHRIRHAAEASTVPGAIVRRFANVLSSASTNPVFLQNTFHSLVVNPSERSYPLARNAYSSARTGGYKWSSDNLAHWQKIFHRAIDPGVRHLHFASRLYADLLADGLRPRRWDILIMIRSIGMSKNASRPILLERHLRDYLDFYPGLLNTRSLVIYLMRGLTAGKSPDDALLAWTLIKRLGQSERPLPVLPLIQSLSTSSRSIHQQAMLEITRAQPVEAQLELLDIVISSIIQRGKASPDPTSLSHEQALGLAGDILREMALKRMSPTPKIATALIRGLVECRQLDKAMSLLDLVSSSGVRVSSSTVGRLMVHLAQAGRCDDVDEVERIWRTRLSSTDVYDRGLIGARAIMDLLRGRKVDLRELERETGWVGNKPFVAYLRSVGLETEADVEAEMETTWTAEAVQPTSAEGICKVEREREKEVEEERVYTAQADHGRGGISMGARHRGPMIHLGMAEVGWAAV